MFERRISPSKLGELEACPKYWQDPNRPQIAAASEGDLMHKALETGDLSALDTDEQKKSVQQCLDYCANLAPRPIPKDGSLRGSIMDYDVVHDEVFLDSDIGKRGKADKLIFPSAEPDHAHLVDAKMGKVPVAHARDNAQGADYAYRVFLRYPHIMKVTVHFLLPRQADATTHTFNREPDFRLLRQRIIGIHERYNDPFAEPTPNFDKACAYCDLKAKCPALGSSAVSVARKLNLLPLPENFAPNQPRTPEERGLAQQLAELLIAWGTETKRFNSDSVKLGAEADGYRLQTKRGITSVKDAGSFVDAVCETYAISPTTLIRAAGSMSLPDTVAFIKAQFPDQDAKVIRESLERTMGAYLQTAPDVSFLVKERKGKKKEEKQRQEINAEENEKMRREIAAHQTET